MLANLVRELDDHDLSVLHTGNTQNGLVGVACVNPLHKFFSRPAPAVNGHLLQTDTFTMYQLLCHVNVPVPADTCLTRTADRAILDSVPGMKRTVAITITYYENFNDFGTPLSVRYHRTSFYLQFPTRKRKRRPFLTQRTLGELGRVCKRRRFILRIPLFYSCTLYYIAELCVLK